MKHNATVTRIAHDLCALMNDEWEEGRKFYFAKAQEIYDREIKPLRNFLVLITEEAAFVMEEPLCRVQFIRLSGLVTNATRALTALKTVKGTS